MTTNAADAAIVTSTIDLGCDVAQGYWIKPPVDGTALTTWLQTSPWATTPIPLRTPGRTA